MLWPGCENCAEGAGKMPALHGDAQGVNSLHEHP